jgi:hypothetical protein
MPSIFDQEPPQTDPNSGKIQKFELRQRAAEAR